MHIQFCGANRQVTGSCHLLEAGGKKILVDCGMFQGGEFNAKKNFEDFPFDPAELDVMLLTHAHLDHVGRIPKLVAEGFTGTIYCTRATAPLAEIVMSDAAKIMMYNNRKFDTPILYSGDDVTAATTLFKGIDYRKRTEVLPGIHATWKDAGHIFGSAFIEVEVEGKRIVFSGDIGNTDAPIIKDTEDMGEVDVLVIESTYGDRIHEERAVARQTLHKLIKDTAEQGGVIMIPAFSIERTQEILHDLNHMIESDMTLPKFPVFLDSPMAIEVTRVFEQFPEYYDAEATAHIKKGDNFLSFDSLTPTYTREQSMQINTAPYPKMIIAGAGMMNGGRILHHAHRYLPDPKSVLIIVGYQAEGSLGRKLYEGAKTVKIFHDPVEVKARVKAIGGMSAHGDQKKLLDWVATAPNAPKQVFCVHGEPNAATTLAHKVRDQFGSECQVPEFAARIEIT
jgi:metallo-beta-lactamase family protein